MALGLSSQIWHAVSQLNPAKPVDEAGGKFVLALVGSGGEVEHMRRFLLGSEPSTQDAVRADTVLREYIHPLDQARTDEIVRADLVIAYAGAPEPQVLTTGRVFGFDPDRPQDVVVSIVKSEVGVDLRLALAKHLPAFRLEIARRVIRDVSTENAIFVVGTALADVLPSVLLPLIGIAEAASDTAVLTANQVRMLFILGAIYNQEVGYKAQWKEIASVVGAAFGWRALARELVSKIPFGGGLAPKGAIAYAGTTAAGEGLIFYYTTGRHMTKAEVKQAFKDSYDRALETAKGLVSRFGSKGKNPKAIQQADTEVEKPKIEN